MLSCDSFDFLVSFAPKPGIVVLMIEEIVGLTFVTGCKGVYRNESILK